MTLSLESITELSIFHFILIFCRMGALMAIMPAIGEIFVPVRIRLLAALAVSWVVFPVLSEKLPPLPDNGVALSLLVLGEIVIGFFIGGLARLLQSVMHTAGMIMAFLSSLAAAQLFDATQGSQGSVFGNFLTITAITLFLATDLHHLMLRGIADSYGVFIPGRQLPFEDLAFITTDMLSHSFVAAFKIAAPMVVVGLAMYLAAGVMGRLMPAMQVFFILVPVQVMVSFHVLMITLSAGMMYYISHFEDSMQIIFYP